MLLVYISKKNNKKIDCQPTDPKMFETLVLGKMDMVAK